jgi:DNA-binding CsgD family transcriptional regulator
MLEAEVAAMIAGSKLAGISPADIGRAATAALGDLESPDLRGSDLVLAGLAVLLSAGYRPAIPVLRRALAALDDPAIFENGVPVWLLAGTFAANVLWDDVAGIAWLQKCETVARHTGALRPLILALTGLAIGCASRGWLTEAERRIEDGRQLGRALGWDDTQLAGFSPLRILAYQGDIERTQLEVDALLRAADAMKCGDMARVAYSVRIVLNLGLSRYADAFEAAAMLRAQDTVHLGGEALPALVEAGARCGRPGEAAAALEELDAWASASGTPWALGLLARSSALLASEEQAERLFCEAISLLSQTTVIIDLARAHLLYGEWLRRQKRRSDACSVLRTAFEMFNEMGAIAFAQRTRKELLAAGDQTLVLAIAQGSTLTAQELHIAQLAASGLTNDEISRQLVISVNTVEYHLKRVFRKLRVASRRKLRNALPEDRRG